MSATIYSAPKSIKKPDYDWSKGRDNWRKEEQRYIDQIKAHNKSIGYNGKNMGEIIKFQVADGYAEYMVLQMRPLSLIHLDIMDGYQFQYAHLMTAKEVNDQLKRQRAMDEIFRKSNTATPDEVVNVLGKVGVETTNMSKQEIGSFDTTTIGDRHFHVKWDSKTYMIPPFSGKVYGENSHNVFKFLVNNYGV